MKKKLKYILKLISVCLLSGIIFIGSGYLYLDGELETSEKPTESIPYYNPIPENKGIMFDIYGDRTLIYMNFEEETITAVFDNKNTQVGENLYGYSVDYFVEGNYDLLAGIINIAEGINLDISGENLRYTGVQVTDLLSRTDNKTELKRELITKILEKLKSTGFSREDFLFLIENSKTTLTIPDCYDWSDYIGDLCKNFKILNPSFNWQKEKIDIYLTMNKIHLIWRLNFGKDKWTFRHKRF